MIAVFDTNILIDALNGVANADAEYCRYERVLISCITWIEVMVGAKASEEKQLRDFLDTNFEVIPLDNAIAEAAVLLRRQHHLRLPDAVIWDTAQVNGADLVTRNTKDFKPEWAGIRVPYTL
ncbi:MAG: type II toxin-antitoxin system VapC family toxin [Anaerolineae bacterium]|nr:type II toxin-antitoxin system VapC family toxin [Anaerolineae bacterium]